jgi:predicted transport protein
MEDGLKNKTGKSLEEWIKLVKAANFEKHGQIMSFLKSEHGLTHGYANTIALKAREADAASFDEADLIAAQYAGKELLKPIYDKLATLVKTFGDDVELVPKKANVSVRAKRQFALIQPSTKSRIDVGLKYDQAPEDERILDSGSFGTMCTNRIILTSQEEVDDQVGDWLREAYLQAK